MTLLRPFQPDRDRPWDRVRVGHLLRRAGFAPSEEEIVAALEAGPAATVARLIDEQNDASRHDELDETGRALAMRQEIAGLRAWWLARLCATRRPLRARMALFWHNHFATSNAKVQNPPLMLQQLRTFERYALGKFEDLLLAVSRDPAMIVWLDGNENAKGRPNENYARELFELFALGVGNYSERDIREAARAFTGWHVRGGVFRFLPSEHDDGEKTVFGTHGRLDGGDVVKLTVQNPDCSRFLSEKLLREFVCPHPPEELIREFAGVLRESGLDIGVALRTLLTSEAFFEPSRYRARIKSAVEFGVGLIRSLNLKVAASALAEGISQAGQRLFEPPSVKGWDGHRAWLNSATMLVRLNGAMRAVGGEFLNAAAFRGRYELNGRENAAAFCERLLLDGNVSAALRESYPDDTASLDELLRGVLCVLACSPEYQMA